MLEKPPIPDSTLIAHLQSEYGLVIHTLEFLPIGYDAHASVYRVLTRDGQRCFLKLKQGTIHEAAVITPHALRAHGIDQVVAPLPTLTNALWTTLDTYSVLLYPYIDGEVGMQVGLSEAQWIAFGQVIRRIHTTSLPELAAHVPREDFIPSIKHQAMMQRFAMLANEHYTHPIDQECAAFWRDHLADMRLLVDRAVTLGQRLQQRPCEFVLCHADIHTANLLLTPDGSLHIVDWDQPIFAPIERDLMFIVGVRNKDVGLSAHEETMFFRGYGDVSTDTLTLAYYRYSRAVEDIAEFTQSLLAPDASDALKADSMRWLRKMFAPGHIVAQAHEFDSVHFREG